jgi:acyl-CoA thioesterase
MHQFDEATAIEVVEAGARYAGAVTEDWSISGIPNGGYLTAIAMRAMAQAAPHPDPFSVTTHYLRPARPGPVMIDVAVVRAGRRHATVEATISQDGEGVARVLGLYGDFSAFAGPTLVTGTPPQLPDPDSLPSSLTIPGLPAIARAFDLRLDPDSTQGILGRPDGRPEVAGWVRFADGREPDTLSLVTVADALPPAILNLLTARWVPTLELTVHFRGRPAPGWLRARFATRFLVEGILEEDGDVWDSSGRLVALSRQLALVQESHGETPS